MKQYVENQTFGKLMRTIGYIAILFASSMLSLTYIFAQDANFIFLDVMRDTAQPLYDALSSVDIFMDSANYVLALFIGFLLLIWTLKKSGFVKVLESILLIAGFAFIFYMQDMTLTYVSFVTPDWLTPTLDLIADYMDQALALNEFIMPLIVLVIVTMLWHMFAVKKPKRLAVSLMRAGTVMLFISVLIIFASTVILDRFELDATIFETIKGYTYLLTFDLYVLGSAFGILGFMRK